MVTITSPNTGCENCVVNLQPGLQHHAGPVENSLWLSVKLLGKRKMIPGKACCGASVGQFSKEGCPKLVKKSISELSKIYFGINACLHFLSDNRADVF